MLIDCDSCAVKDLQCGECVMTVLLGDPDQAAGQPPGRRDVDGEAAAALAVLAEGGLVPHLKLVARDPGPVERAG